jgi:LCP family protein required for cell wall assembly
MKRRPSRRMKILGWVSIALATVVVVSTLGLYVAVRLKLDAIRHVTRIDTSNRPKQYTKALNIMLLGSDSRAGRNARLGGLNGCNCSDTIMVVHISPGRGKVTVLSIPRDTMVPTYACSATGGLPGQQKDLLAYERINNTLETGGPECVRHTVEQQTGIFISDFIQLDFSGFVHVINDIHGVNICVPFAVNDPKFGGHGTGLKLSPGRHHIYGQVALKFWRARYALADGTDTARIARDQYLMAQLVKGVLHSGLLSSPAKLYTVMGDVAKAMTTDASTSDLLGIVTSLSGLSSKNVQFITAPSAPWPYDNNELEFAQPQSAAVFAAIAHDSRLPKAGKGGTSSGGQLLTISPSKVMVKVLNGSGISRQAHHAATALTALGFDVVSTGNVPGLSYAKSVIEYSSAADRPAANTLQEQFPSATFKLVPGLTAGTVQVILGTNFTGLASQPSPSSSPSSPPTSSPTASPTPTPAAIGGLSGSYGGITGNVGCRNSAFYGPNSPAPAGPVPCGC